MGEAIPIVTPATDPPSSGTVDVNGYLRPQSLDDFFGQEDVLQELKVSIQAAKQRGEPLDHVIFHGPPGLGKTTLAHIIAREMEVNIRTTSGPAIARSGDLASILTSLEEGDVLFIDEIHRLSHNVEEVLYPAMEDFCLDIILGKGPSARTLRLDLNRFTIVGATTRIGMLSAPLRSRFGVSLRLNFYSPQVLQNIIARSAKVFGLHLDKEAALTIAQRSRGTPRVANRILKRVRDYSQVNEMSSINQEVVEEALAMLGIDTLGLEDTDRRILLTIVEKFNGGPVGSQTLAASVSEDIGTLEDVHEPYLMQIGFIKRTSRGRVATLKAYKHLGITPTGKQVPLLS